MWVERYMTSFSLNLLHVLLCANAQVQSIHLQRWIRSIGLNFFSKQMDNIIEPCTLYYFVACSIQIHFIEKKFNKRFLGAHDEGWTFDLPDSWMKRQLITHFMSRYWVYTKRIHKSGNQWSVNQSATQQQWSVVWNFEWKISAWSWKGLISSGLWSDTFAEI